jgi:hypothetical protein
MTFELHICQHIDSFRFRVYLVPNKEKTGGGLLGYAVCRLGDVALALCSAVLSAVSTRAGRSHMEWRRARRHTVALCLYGVLQLERPSQHCL